MAFKLEPLPYPRDALAPHLSSETLALHHGKHHAGYVKKLNELIAGTPQADADLESLVRGSVGPVFDNAAQIWNHDFYWRSMKPAGGGEPAAGRLGVAIARDFGSFASFRRAFLEAGEAHFGSGWLWLVRYDGRLRVLTTSDADLPMVYRATALLGVDLWEHAYYLDYHNERGKYLKAVVDHLVDWDFAAANWRASESAPPSHRLQRAPLSRRGRRVSA